MIKKRKHEVLIEPAKLAIYSEEVGEVISAVPSWLLRRGIMLILIIIVSLIGLSVFIKYPEIVKANLKVNSSNSPKQVFTKKAGKIVKILVNEGDLIAQGQPLIFMESTGEHEDVMALKKWLLNANNILKNESQEIDEPTIGLKLGELQAAFQNFHQSFLQFLSAKKGGYYLNKYKYLNRDLTQIHDLRKEIIKQQSIQEREFANTEAEFDAYKKLYDRNVISKIEFKQQENKYLAAKYPLQQTATQLLNNNAVLAAKQSEILEMEHTIADERAKFVQALYNMITLTDSWISDYVVTAPIAGRVNYSGIIQNYQSVSQGQELFVINSDSMDFFGEVYILQYNMGKVRKGMNALVNIKSYPHEEFGFVRGKVVYISDVPIRDSVYAAKVSFEKFEDKSSEQKITLKNGMLGEVEIITEDSSLFRRLFRSLTQNLNI